MRNRPVIYLDMDGVIADFEKAYTNIDGKFEKDYKKFRHAVLERKIFEELDYMENGRELIFFLESHDIPIEILSSVGSSEKDMVEAGSVQKTRWLHDRGLFYPRNFVTKFSHKADYFAHSLSLLIDDREDIIRDFRQAGGIGVLYKASEFEKMKKDIFWALKGLDYRTTYANLYI